MKLYLNIPRSNSCLFRMMSIYYHLKSLIHYFSFAKPNANIILLGFLWTLGSMKDMKEEKEEENITFFSINSLFLNVILLVKFWKTKGGGGGEGGIYEFKIG